MDYEGIKTLLRGADQAFPRLRQLWLDAGYRGEGKGADWALRRPWDGAWIWWSVRRSPPRRGALMAWAREWEREGVAVDWQKLLPPRGFVVVPRRWMVERTIAWIDHHRHMSLGTTSVYRRAQKPSSTWR